MADEPKLQAVIVLPPPVIRGEGKYTPPPKTK
jgi:hypothetical protein